MVRDLFFAFLIVLIVAVALFLGVSGLSYIGLVLAALLVSVAFVRRPAPSGEREARESAEGSAEIRPFPRPGATPLGSMGSATSTRRYGAGPIQSRG